MRADNSGLDRPFSCLSPPSGTYRVPLRREPSGSRRFFFAGSSHAPGGRYRRQAATAAAHRGAPATNVNLIPFSKKYLQLYEALPFGVRDANGQLLLAAGQRLESRERLAALLAKPLFADETESSDWRRRLVATVDGMIRRNESLKVIAAARPVEDDDAADAGVGPLATVQVAGWVQSVDAALRDPRADGPWVARVRALQGAIAQAMPRRLDGALYHLIYTAGHDTTQYSSHHAVLCAIIAAEAARVLGWPDAEVQAIALAALTMNVSMRRLQDQLAAQDMPLSDAVRAQIREHPQRSVDMLQAAGVHDTGWLETVRRHHDDDCGASAAAGAAHGDEPCRAAQLLRRVDIFAAKLSRRVTRVPMSPVQAAREACLGRDGKPDALGAALLKTVGLYPPGSFVELASGEQAIVVSRGSQTNQPLVAALVGASGAPLGEPTLRHTAERPHAVRGALACGAVRVIPPHERVLALL